MKVVQEKNISGGSNPSLSEEALTHMFKKIEFESILAFLGGESTLKQELSIMNSVPLAPFLGSGIKQMIKFNS